MFSLIVTQDKQRQDEREDANGKIDGEDRIPAKAGCEVPSKRWTKGRSEQQRNHEYDYRTGTLRRPKEAKDDGHGDR